MFKFENPEKIRKMNYAELRKYIFAIPWQYEETIKYPDEAKIDGFTRKEAKRIGDKINHLISDIKYDIKIDPLPGTDELIGCLRKEYDRFYEIVKKFETEEYFEVPFTSKTYLFKDVREVYARNAEMGRYLATKRIQDYLMRHSAGSNLMGVAHKIVKALGVADATKEN